MSRATEVSTQIRTKYNITIKKKTAFYASSPAVVQFFIIMSNRVKTVLRNYLSIMEAQLEMEETKLYLTLSKSDTISKAISQAIAQLDILCAPIENFLAQFPVDTMILTAATDGTLTEPAEDVKQAANSVLSGVAGSNPVQIPQSVRSSLSALGFDCVSFFSGVQTFKDLKDKIKILGFKAARATSSANEAATGIEYCKAKLEEYSIYKDILDLIS